MRLVIYVPTILVLGRLWLNQTVPADDIEYAAENSSHRSSIRDRVFAHAVRLFKSAALILCQPLPVYRDPIVMAVPEVVCARSSWMQFSHIQYYNDPSALVRMIINRPHS